MIVYTQNKQTGKVTLYKAHKESTALRAAALATVMARKATQDECVEHAATLIDLTTESRND